jgi:acetyltransferase-like isoleucine patch superfamily enzyme
LYKIYGKSTIGKGTVIGDNVIIGYPSREELSPNNSLDPGTLKNITGTNIGNNCILRDFGVIYSETILGDNIQTGHHYLIREKTTIGNGTLIGSNVIIENKCKIGNNVSIQSGVYIPTYCEIGNDVFLGPNAVLTNDKYIGYKDPRKQKMEGVIIEEKAAIGANSTILPGIRIGRNVVVGSGAVVTKDVHAGEVVVGVPAKVIDRIKIID